MPFDLNLIGLLLDALGFAVLSWDLFASAREGHQMKDDLLNQQIANRLTANVALGAWAAPSGPTDDYDQMTAENQATEARRVAEVEAFARRKGIVAVATALIAIGFILQIIGTLYQA